MEDGQSKTTGDGYVAVTTVISVPFVIGFICLTFVRSLFWHHGISLRTARRLRNCLLRDLAWRWYHLGVVPWISLNAILYKFDCDNSRLDCRDCTGRRGIEAFCAFREACTRDSDIEDLCRVRNEIEERDYASFIRRDQKFFDEREGMVLTDPAKVFVRNVLVMRQDDFETLYHVLGLLCRQFLERMDKLHLMDSVVIRYFVQNDREKFIGLRKRLLNRLKTYSHNMIMYTAKADRQTAHAWHEVCCKVVHLQEMEVNEENEERIRNDAEALIERMDVACGFTSVYKAAHPQSAAADEAEARESQPPADEARPDGNNPADVFEGVNYDDPESCLNWFRAHVGWTCHRLEICQEKDGNGFYIVDNLRRRKLNTPEERAKYEYHGMTAALKMRVVLRLLEQFAKNPGKAIASVKGEKWKSRFPSAEVYGRFKNTQIYNVKNGNGTYTNKWRFLTDDEVCKLMRKGRRGNG